MTNSTPTIADIARASYEAARAAIPVTGSPNTQLHLRAVSAGVVDALVDASEAAALRVVQPASHIAAMTVWENVLDRLAASWLTDNVYCTRTGRRLYQVQPDDWLDYLTLIASVQEGDPQREAAIDRLVSAIVALKGGAVAPVVLDVSGAGLAVSKLVDLRDFCLISIARFFPRARQSSGPSINAGAINSTMLDAAQRGEILAQCREVMADLPRPVLAYAAECLTLYLSNIDPAKLPPGHNLLDHYAGDFVAPWRSAAAVAHLCGRLVQGMVAEISKLRLKPLDSLTKADLRRLRVHYTGSDAYAGIRGQSAAWRASLKASQAPVMSHQHIERLKLLSADPDLAALLDTLDLQTAIAATGRNVPVDLSAPDATIALDRRELAAKARAADADALIGDVLDISAMLLNGDLPPEFLPMIEAETDLVDAGLFTADELAELDLDFIGGADDAAPSENDFDFAIAEAILGSLDLPTEATAKLPKRKPLAMSKPQSANPDDAQAAMLFAALAEPAPKILSPAKRRALSIPSHKSPQSANPVPALVAPVAPVMQVLPSRPAHNVQATKRRPVQRG